MKLTIHNFAKIESAALKLDGMTVICGNNNTGKSTVGKALATLIESFVDQESKILEARKIKYRSILYKRIRSSRLYLINHGEENILNKITDGSLADGELSTYLKNISTENVDSDYVQAVVKQIKEVRAIPDSELKRQIAHNCFYDVFRMQHIPLRGRVSGNTELILEYQGSKIKMAFSQDVNSLPELEDEVDLRHHAFFIDTADILDYVNDYLGFPPIQGGNLNHFVIDAIYSRIENERKNPNVIDDYLVNAKIKSIYEKIANTLNGDLVVESETIYLHEDDMTRNLEVTNLSKGIKAFALLQLLLKEHVLQQEDVLILDEPEIHLHPAWQVLYAEILVLLQKAFSLKVLLTTHSSYFLEAIQLFCRKHHQKGILHVYQSAIQQDSGMASITEVDSKKATSVYASFLEPLNTLQDLRNELKERK